MTILILLVPLGVLMVVIAAVAFVWAVRHGQFEDLESEGSRILFENAPIREPRETASQESGDRE